MLQHARVEPRRGHPARHGFVREAEPGMGVAVAQLLALVRGEIDDQQASAGREEPRRLATAAAGCCA
jgi:hypothetical protein